MRAYTRTTDSRRLAQERRGQLAEELDLGKIPYSNINKAEHPEAFARIVAFLKAHMGDKWPPMYHQLIDSLDPIQVCIISSERRAEIM